MRLNGRWLRTEADYDSVYANGLAPDFRTLFRGVATSREAMDSYTLDNQVEGRLTTGPVNHTVLAGFDYQRLDGHYAPGFGVGPTQDVFAPVYGLPIVPPATSRTDLKVNQYGVYLQDQLQLGGFILTLAGRSDWVEVEDGYRVRDLAPVGSGTDRPRRPDLRLRERHRTLCQLREVVHAADRHRFLWQPLRSRGGNPV